jgi:hypothetical protein
MERELGDERENTDTTEEENSKNARQDSVSDDELISSTFVMEHLSCLPNDSSERKEHDTERKHIELIH